MKINNKILSQIPQNYDGMHGQEIIDKHDLSHIEGISDAIKEEMLEKGILKVLPFNADGEKYGSSYSIRNGQGLVLSDLGKELLNEKGEDEPEAEPVKKAKKK